MRAWTHTRIHKHRRTRTSAHTWKSILFFSPFFNFNRPICRVDVSDLLVASKQLGLEPLRPIIYSLPSRASALPIMPTRPYHAGLLSCTSLNIYPAFDVHLAISSIILSSFVTPPIYPAIPISAIYPTVSIALSSPPMFQSCTPLLFWPQTCTQFNTNDTSIPLRTGHVAYKVLSFEHIRYNVILLSLLILLSYNVLLNTYQSWNEFNWSCSCSSLGGTRWQFEVNHSRDTQKAATASTQSTHATRRVSTSSVTNLLVLCTSVTTFRLYVLQWQTVWSYVLVANLLVLCTSVTTFRLYVLQWQTFLSYVLQWHTFWSYVRQWQHSSCMFFSDKPSGRMYFCGKPSGRMHFSDKPSGLMYISDNIPVVCSSVTNRLVVCTFVANLQVVSLQWQTFWSYVRQWQHSGCMFFSDKPSGRMYFCGKPSGRMHFSDKLSGLMYISDNIPVVCSSVTNRLVVCTSVANLQVVCTSVTNLLVLCTSVTTFRLYVLQWQTVWSYHFCGKPSVLRILSLQRVSITRHDIHV